MEEQEHVSWGGFAMTLPEYVWNVLVLSGSLSASAPSSKAKAATLELQAKSLHDLNPSLYPQATQDQIMLRANQHSQTSLVETRPLQRTRRPRGGLFSWALVGVIQKGAVLALVLGLILYPDFKLRREQRVQEMQLKGANCALDYDRNKCDISTRVPFVEQDCRDWELCMMQTNIDSLSIITEMLGETISHFFDYMNWTALLFLLSVVVICTLYCLRTAK